MAEVLAGAAKSRESGCGLPVWVRGIYLFLPGWQEIFRLYIRGITYGIVEYYRLLCVMYDGFLLEKYGHFW